MRNIDIVVEPVSVKPKKLAFIPGETITVDFQSPSFYPKDAWIVMVRSDATHEKAGHGEKSIMAMHKIDKRTKGAVTFKAPEPGTYQVRLNDDGGNGDPIKRTRHGTVIFKAPKPGTYHLHFNDDGGNGDDGKFTGFNRAGGGKEVRFVEFVVEPARVTPNKLAFVPGESMEVAYEAPSWYSDDSFIAIVKNNAANPIAGGQEDSTILEFHEMKRTNADIDRARRFKDPLKRFRKGSLTFTAPAEPGTYDLRFNDDGGNGKDGKFKGFLGKPGGVDTRLATFTVEPVSVTMARNTYVEGEEITFEVEVPSFYPDTAFVALIRSDAPASKLGTRDPRHQR